MKLDYLQDISRAGLRRLARRGGVAYYDVFFTIAEHQEQEEKAAYNQALRKQEDARQDLAGFLEEVLRNAIHRAGDDQRQTVSLEDMQEALEDLAAEGTSYGKN